MSNLIRPISVSELTQDVSVLDIPCGDKLTLIGVIHAVAAQEEAPHSIDTKSEFAQVYGRLIDVGERQSVPSRKFANTARDWFHLRFQPVAHHQTIPVQDNSWSLDLPCTGTCGRGWML